jgi:hypothetical protein
MNIIEQAVIFATAAHTGQVDKNGQPYILHLLRVMLDVISQGMSDKAVAAAVLHDVVEDKRATLDSIREAFGSGVAVTVEYLSRREGELYFDYIDRVIRGGWIVRAITQADIRDNMDLGRITNEHGMYSRYAKAYLKIKEAG